MQEFQGKTAVITGGASGIGLAMGKLFAQQGMNIVLADIEKDVLEVAVAEVVAGGANCIGVSTNVASAEEVEALAERAVSEFGGIHIACNNAGVFAGGLLWEESLAYDCPSGGLSSREHRLHGSRYSYAIFGHLPHDQALCAGR